MVPPEQAMSTPGANLVNVEAVSQAFGERVLLSDVSLGVQGGDRIGIVGRNGSGKSTLLAILGGALGPARGRVSTAGGARIGLLSQRAEHAAGVTVRAWLLGSRAEHEWASDARTRDVLNGLLGGVQSDLLDRELLALSGGERRRVELARLLTDDLDLLLLDEPTNHLDIEAVSWLAGHLRGRPRLAVVVVTHDRWFLDETCDRMWEVVRGTVEEYDGGYSAYVLAKAERMRQEKAEVARRNNLIRKELAWLRRGAPARTSKPKFRVDAANALIAEEPPVRDGAQLLSFANARLGRTVFDLDDVTVTLGDRTLLDHVTTTFAPGQRVGLLGPNGAGKTTLLRALVGDLETDAGTVTRGTTVRLAYLSQHLDELDPDQRVLEAVEDVARRVELGNGKELTASQLCERLGFGADAQWTPVRDLSGGERRRLQLTRLLMSAPNVLILDEPTNDFDVETLTALEDLLDGFAGTLIVVSHDRYFLERVNDGFIAVPGDGRILDLPRGVEGYLDLRSGTTPADGSWAERTGRDGSTAGSARPTSDGRDARERRKAAERLERQIAALERSEAQLHERMAAAAHDYAAIRDLGDELRRIQRERASLEDEWLEVAGTD